MQSQNTENPLISIVLPVKNGAETLSACLQSLIFQNYSHIEIIAVDDFSRDNSYQILRAFQKEDKRIKIIKNIKPYGLSISLNRGIRKAKGTFIIFIEQTDTITPQKITKQLAALIKDVRAVGANSQSMLSNNQGKRIGKTSFEAEASLTTHLPHRPSALFSGLMISRTRIPKDLLMVMHDDMQLIAADTISKLLHFGKIINLPEFLHAHVDPSAAAFSLPSKIINVTKLWWQAKIDNRSVPSFSRIILGML